MNSQDIKNAISGALVVDKDIKNGNSWLRWLKLMRFGYQKSNAADLPVDGSSNTTLQALLEIL